MDVAPFIIALEVKGTPAHYQQYNCESTAKKSTEAHSDAVQPFLHLLHKVAGVDVGAIQRIAPSRKDLAVAYVIHRRITTRRLPTLINCVRAKPLLLEVKRVVKTVVSIAAQLQKIKVVLFWTVGNLH